jgi:retron-type reverse transcriptase
MKRIGYLYEQAFTEENLYQAFLDARKNKRNRKACFQFEKNLGSELKQLKQELSSGVYKPQPYFTFNVYEPKLRVIYAPAFRDCVVQHAIYRIIYPIFDKMFINTSYACRKNKGTHKASFYTQYALNQYGDDTYTLKLDIRKFFYRIDRNVLRSLLERKIKDKRFVNLLMLFTEYGEPKGIPIGNLLSQLFALIYLSPLDRFIKDNLRIRHYVRYVDDFILFGLTRNQCLDFKAKIEFFLEKVLKMELSKVIIQKTKNGVNFVGFRTWKGKKLVRKHSLHKYRIALVKGKQESIISLLGHALYTTSLRYMLQLLKSKYTTSPVWLPKRYVKLAY